MRSISPEGSQMAWSDPCMSLYISEPVLVENALLVHQNFLPNIWNTDCWPISTT